MDKDGEVTTLAFNENPILEPIESVEVKTYHTDTIKFSAQVKAKWRNRVRLLQVLGFLRPPKLTYKTIKRNCAKRNGR